MLLLPMPSEEKIKMLLQRRFILRLLLQYWQESASPLPEDYETACFDYYIFISINYKYERITAIFDEGILKGEKIEIVKQILRDYVQFPCVEEVYTMDKEETPLLYAAKVNPSSSFNKS